jgi:hypothetical protein
MAMPAVGVRILVALLSGVCLLGLILYSTRSCHEDGFPTEGVASVWFELTPALANVPGPIRLLACVEETCVRRHGSPVHWEPFFNVNHAAFTDPETIDVRLVLRDDRGVFFDATSLIQFDESQPTGRCNPTLFNAGVQATPAGELVTMIPASV